MEGYQYMTNIQRTLDWLRKKCKWCEQIDIAFTEKKIPYTKLKKDLFGIIDLLVLVPKPHVNNYWGLWGIQVCGGNDYAAHKKKILASRNAYKWVRGDNRVLILIGWRELKKGWSPRIHRFSRGDWASMPPPLTPKVSTPKVDRL